MYREPITNKSAVCVCACACVCGCVGVCVCVCARARERERDLLPLAKFAGGQHNSAPHSARRHTASPKSKRESKSAAKDMHKEAPHSVLLNKTQKHGGGRGGGEGGSCAKTTQGGENPEICRAYLSGGSHP